MNNSAQFPRGQTFGLFDTPGNAELSGKMYQAMPPGSTIPTVSLNGDMQGDQPDSNGNALPIRWVLYKGQAGKRPITSAIDTFTTYQGNPTVLLMGLDCVSIDNPPALESRPCTRLVVSEGRSYTFGCALKATGWYGSGASPSLQISWYDSSRRCISSNNRSVLALTSLFTRYSLSGTAPKESAYAHLFVRVGNNAGNIWVGGAMWTPGC